MTILEQRTCDAIIEIARDGITVSDDSPVYWERLAHQFAGMAMQGQISNSHYNPSTDPIKLAKASSAVAIALVEELKKSTAKQQ